MGIIVAACVSQFHDSEDEFELLLAYDDGREIGHAMTRSAARQIAEEIANAIGAEDASRQAEALQRENAEFARAVLEVLNAVRDYLPPDGISAKDCLSRVIGAVDNSDINPLIKKLERANVDA